MSAEDLRLMAGTGAIATAVALLALVIARPFSPGPGRRRATGVPRPSARLRAIADHVTLDAVLGAVWGAGTVAAVFLLGLLAAIHH